MQNFCRAMLLVAPSVFFFHVQAQSTSAYPTKSVRVIASVLHGDTCDVLVRLVGYKMGERLGQQFVIDNRAGASGQIGHAMVAQASADGYTLGCGNGGSMAIVPHAFKKVPYDSLKDFTPIAMMATSFMGLAVSNACPARNIVTLLNREANWAMTQPDFRDKMIASGLDIITESPEHFANFIRSDYARYGKITKEIGLKAQ